MINVHHLQIATIVLDLAALSGIGLWIRRNRQSWLYMIPPITWLAHVLVFYAFVFRRDFFDAGISIDFVFWSALVRLHAASIILGVIVAMLYEVWIIKFQNE